MFERISLSYNLLSDKGFLVINKGFSFVLNSSLKIAFCAPICIINIASYQEMIINLVSSTSQLYTL